ncbi:MULTISPECIES: hypothetical protein [unclassified Mesorhizobium]|uniref:hypothetical protein n=1 Tax=unclassified Mesorhizobium TaxID=325217 RepID=UPI00167191BE|nr:MULTISPECIES: hypothetical protein [unclassified Mesorhizobium]
MSKLPAMPSLPGIEKGNVFSIESVMARHARPGRHVLLLDEGGGWRGCRTAWKLAEDGHQVTILTPDPLVGKELQRTAADFPLRRTLRQLGVKWLVDVSILEWHGDGVTIVDHNTRDESFVQGVCLVLATTNVATDWLAKELEGSSQPVMEVGDGVAPRQAPYAFHEGRKIA